MREGDPAPLDFCVFRCGGEAFALSTHFAKEVVEGRPPTPVPLAPPELLGALNLRGEIVPVVGLESLLGLPPQPPQRIEALLVMGSGQLRFATPIDRVTTVARLEPAKIERDRARASSLASFVDGHTTQSGECLHVLDGERLIHAVARCIAEGFQRRPRAAAHGAESRPTAQEE